MGFMRTYKSLMNIVCKDLIESGIENAQYDVKEILGKALSIDCRSAEFTNVLEKSVSGEVANRFLSLSERRKSGEPLQYILGEWEFYGLPFQVGEGVLIPRQDTETLVEHTILKYQKRRDINIIDLCSGSGCIGITLDKRLSCNKVICVEKSKEALLYLDKNKKINNSNVDVVNGDVLDLNFINTMPTVDLIVCNPPYLTLEDMDNLQCEVTFEPQSALFGGEDGLDFYRDIVRLWKSKLKKGGELMFEIGINQEQEVMKIMIQHGFINVRAKKDLCGVYRVVTGIYNK